MDTFEKQYFTGILGDLSGKKVLDIGCGSGRITRKLLDKGADLVAADISEEMLKRLKKKFRNLTTIKADIEDLPFEDNSFDVVVATFVIVHLKDLQKAFDEVYRVLKPGGFFALSNINQRRAPELKTSSGEKIVIESFYHIPKHVHDALQESFFDVEEDLFVEDNGHWVNQILRARKS